LDAGAIALPLGAVRLRLQKHPAVKTGVASPRHRSGRKMQKRAMLLKGNEVIPLRIHPSVQLVEGLPKPAAEDAN